MRGYIIYILPIGFQADNNIWSILPVHFVDNEITDAAHIFSGMRSVGIPFVSNTRDFAVGAFISLSNLFIIVPMLSKNVGGFVFTIHSPFVMKICIFLA